MMFVTAPMGRARPVLQSAHGSTQPVRRLLAEKKRTASFAGRRHSGEGAPEWHGGCYPKRLMSVEHAIPSPTVTRRDHQSVQHSRDANLATRNATLLLTGIVIFATTQGARIGAGEIAAQLNYVREHVWLFKLENVTGALLTLPSIMLIGWIADQRRRSGQVDAGLVFGVISLVVYLVLVSVAYASQYVLVASWLDDDSLDAAWMSMLYLDAPSSATGLLKLVGYTFCSLASVLVGFPTSTPPTISKWVTSLLFASGAVGLLGWLECTLLSSNTGWGLALSGLLVIPYCIAILVTQRRRRREATV